MGRGMGTEVPMSACPIHWPPLQRLDLSDLLGEAKGRGAPPLRKGSLVQRIETGAGQLVEHMESAAPRRTSAEP